MVTNPGGEAPVPPAFGLGMVAVTTAPFPPSRASSDMTNCIRIVTVWPKRSASKSESSNENAAVTLNASPALIPLGTFRDTMFWEGHEGWRLNSLILKVGTAGGDFAVTISKSTNSKTASLCCAGTVQLRSWSFFAVSGYTQAGLPLGDSTSVLAPVHCISSMGVPRLNCWYGGRIVSDSAGVKGIMPSPIARTTNGSSIITFDIASLEESCLLNTTSISRTPLYGDQVRPE